MRVKLQDLQAQATHTSFHQFASVMLSRLPRLATLGGGVYLGMVPWLGQ